MLKVSNIFPYVLLMILLQSQYTAPNERTYDNNCTVQFDRTGTAVAYYNDPNGDCISNDWVIYFNYSNGSIGVYDQDRWAKENPGSEGYYDFGDSFWEDCCNEYIDESRGGGDENGQSDSLCPCEWEYNPNIGVLTINCPLDC